MEVDTLISPAPCVLHPPTPNKQAFTTSCCRHGNPNISQMVAAQVSSAAQIPSAARLRGQTNSAKAMVESKQTLAKAMVESKQTLATIVWLALYLECFSLLLLLLPDVCVFSRVSVRERDTHTYTYTYTHTHTSVVLGSKEQATRDLGRTKPLFQGTCVLHPRFPRFSSFPSTLPCRLRKTIR